MKIVGYISNFKPVKKEELPTAFDWICGIGFVVVFFAVIGFLLVV